ncbi:hypothetical protein [Lutibacter sp.]
MKKLATYFFAAVFFVAIFPRQCNFPNPNEEEMVSVTEQQQTLTTMDDVNFIKS